MARRRHQRPLSPTGNPWTGASLHPSERKRVRKKNRPFPNPQSVTLARKAAKAREAAVGHPPTLLRKRGRDAKA